jgi:hypothetical protein
VERFGAKSRVPVPSNNFVPDLGSLTQPQAGVVIRLPLFALFQKGDLEPHLHYLAADTHGRADDA